MGFDVGGVKGLFIGTTGTNPWQEGHYIQEQSHWVGKGPMDPLQPWRSNLGARGCNVRSISILVLKFLYEFILKL